MRCAPLRHLTALNHFSCLLLLWWCVDEGWSGQHVRSRLHHTPITQSQCYSYGAWREEWAICMVSTDVASTHSSGAGKIGSSRVRSRRRDAPRQYDHVPSWHAAISVCTLVFIETGGGECHQGGTEAERAAEGRGRARGREGEAERKRWEERERDLRGEM